jgi:hypothetical protein
VQEDVSSTFADISNELAKWRKLPSKSPKAEPARQKILSSLSELQVDLQDLQSTIDIALKDPTKFALTPSELMTRQEFVRDLQARANDARDLLEGGAPQAGGRLAAAGASQRNDRQTLLSSGARSSDLDVEAGALGGTSSTREERGAAWHDNEDAIVAAQQQQQQHVANQDQELSTIGRSLVRRFDLT